MAGAPCAPLLWKRQCRWQARLAPVRAQPFYVEVAPPPLPRMQNGVAGLVALRAIRAILGRKVRQPLRGIPPAAIGEANTPTPLNSNCVSIIPILGKMLTHFILPESLIL